MQIITNYVRMLIKIISAKKTVPEIMNFSDLRDALFHRDTAINCGQYSIRNSEIIFDGGMG